MSETQSSKDFDLIIADLKERYKGYPLFQITDNMTGEVFILRGSNWDEFAQIGNVKPGHENRVPLNMVKAYVVWPEIDAVDLEYNKSGDWQPGRIVARPSRLRLSMTAFKSKAR